MVLRTKIKFHAVQIISEFFNYTNVLAVMYIWVSEVGKDAQRAGKETSNQKILP